MVVRAGVDGTKGTIGLAAMSADAGSQAGYTLKSGEPVVFSDLRSESRFQSEPLLAEHGIISGASVAIGMHQKTYGVLGVYSTRSRSSGATTCSSCWRWPTRSPWRWNAGGRRTSCGSSPRFAELNPNPAMELSAAAAVTYFNVAAGRLAESLGFKHPRELLPADIETAVHTCLATGQSRLQLEFPDPGARPILVPAPGDLEPGGPLLFHRHHRPVETGSAGAAVTETGNLRPAGVRPGS